MVSLMKTTILIINTNPSKTFYKNISQLILWTQFYPGIKTRKHSKTVDQLSPMNIDTKLLKKQTKNSSTREHGTQQQIKRIIHHDHEPYGMWILSWTLKKQPVCLALTIIIENSKHLIFTGHEKMIMAFTKGLLHNEMYIILFCLKKNNAFFNMHRWSEKAYKPTGVTSNKWDSGMERFGLLQHTCTILVIKNKNSNQSHNSYGAADNMDAH